MSSKVKVTEDICQNTFFELNSIGCTASYGRMNANKQGGDKGCELTGYRQPERSRHPWQQTGEFCLVFEKLFV